ncbi:hypothetical protein ACIQF6_27945 [Kitasatospora sp. NPDC092948]|uniref:hypothetical protein n=1 Tax=Kitasatospora sp. NPDC092948 TaxID=3364088 RepID=UPI003807798D
MTAMILLFPLPVTWRHLRTLRQPALDVPRSSRLVSWAVVSAWLLPVIAAWASMPGNNAVVLASILLWLITPPTLAVAAARYRTLEHREEDVLRAAQGLPLRRRLISPWKIGALWAAAAFTLMLTVVVGPALATPPGQAVQRSTHLLDLVLIPVLLGAVHTTTQFVRREREAARALHADRLAVGLAATRPGR